MEEKRKFNRLYLETELKTTVSYSGLKEEVEISDISAAGMKVSFLKPLDVGTIVYGEFRVLPHLGPFFVKGKISRVIQKGENFETAIEFDKVSSLPLAV